ncbi:hypothetical protein [Microbacterium sp. NPDC057650]|uniref:hypothetical protein n=1 Tax=unclassified Microbacterium TaxID=2609290 RepID=UPI00366EBE6C
MSETSEAVDAPTAREVPPDRFLSFVWQAWPWMNWLMPAFFCVSGLFREGGWMALIMLMVSPILIPAAGLLQSLPRMLLRRSGARQAPAPIAPLLFVTWWSWFLLAISMQDAGDGPTTPSILENITGTIQSSSFLGAVLGAAALGILLSGFAILMLAVTLPRGAASSRPWRITAMVSVVAVPALIFGFVFAFASAAAAEVQARTDAAGDTVAEAQARSLEEQGQLAAQRYEKNQRTLSEVRALIAPDGWAEAAGGGAPTRDAPGCSREVDCYDVFAGFSSDAFGEDGPRIDLDALETRLTAQGWEKGRWFGAEDRGLVVTDADGAELTVTDWGEISLNSPAWWGDWYDFADQIESDRDIADQELAPTYAADEWPPL